MDERLNSKVTQPIINLPYMADVRLKYIMDSKAIEKFGYRRGIEKGREEGRQLEGRIGGLDQPWVNKHPKATW